MLQALGIHFQRDRVDTLVISLTCTFIYLSRSYLARVNVTLYKSVLNVQVLIRKITQL